MTVAGLDIGGTKCAAILAEIQGSEVKFLSREEIATAGDWQTITVRLLEMLRQSALSNGIEFSSIASVGVSCGGPLSAKKGLILSPPNLPGWDNVPICDFIQKNCGIEAHLLNDADACAVAEWKFGAGQNCENMIFLTFGTGLGAGLILNGRLYSGSDNMAGEVGHVRLCENGPVGYGKRGSFEGFCSGAGIARQAETYFTEKLQCGIKSPLCSSASDLKTLTAKNLAAAAFNGDADAIKIFAECGTHLGKGIAVLVDILNPEKIVIGGVYMRAHELISKSLIAALQAECLPISFKNITVVPAALGEKIGDYGAIVAGLKI